MWMTLRIECRKLWRQPLERWLAFGLVFLAPLVLVLGGVPEGLTRSGGRPLRQGLQTAAHLWPILGFVIGPVVGAHNIGAELSLGTLPLMVSRTGSRSGVLAAKALAQSLYFILLVTLTTAAACTAAAMTGSEGRGLHGDEFGIWLATGMLFAILVTMVLFGVVALVMTYIARSAAAGVGIALTLQLVGSNTFGEALAPYLPWYYIQQASTVVTWDHARVVWRAEGLAGAAAVIGYAAAILAGGNALMSRRDVG